MGDMQPVTIDTALFDSGTLESLLRESVGTLYTAAELLVQHAGRPILHSSAGSLDGRPLGLGRRFDLASLTKLFTATAVLRLVDAERIALDQPVAEIIPEIDGERAIGAFEEPLTGIVRSFPYEQRSADAGTITIRHLLSHTSGLPAWMPLYRMNSSDAAWHLLFNTTLAYPPGARIVYSDLGYILLGEAVARVVGKPLAAALEQLVSHPIGATATGYRPPAERWAGTVPTEQCVWRGRRIRGEVHDENAARLGGVSGHAGLFGSATDLARLAQATLDSQRGERVGTLLAPSTAREMLREHANDGTQRRALGWALRLPESSCGLYWNVDGYGHTGFTGTSLWVDPQRDLIVVLLTNRVYFGRDNGDAIHDLRLRVHNAVGSAFS